MNLNNYKKLSVTQKIIVIAINFLLIIFIIANFFIFPAISDIKKLNKNIISQKIDLQNKLINEKNLISLNEKIDKIKPQLDKFNQIFINQNRDLEFITTMEGIAEKNNISQKITFDPAAGITEQDHKKVLINFELSCDYANFIKYLDNLETLPYYINIYKIDIATGDSNFNQAIQYNLKPKNNINITMSADTFWK
jgi:hypothetical protein